MASGRLFIPGWMPARDSNGDPIPNVVVSFYQNETDVLASVYADDALTVPLTNPVAANSSGRFPQIYASDAMTYSASVDAPYGPAGQPFTFDGLQASQAADIAAANLAQGAAEDAEAALAATEAAIDAATQVGGGAAALAGALAGDTAGTAAANAVVATKADTDGDNLLPGFAQGAESIGLVAQPTPFAYGADGISAALNTAALNAMFALGIKSINITRDIVINSITVPAGTVFRIADGVTIKRNPADTSVQFITCTGRGNKFLGGKIDGQASLTAFPHTILTFIGASEFEVACDIVNPKQVGGSYGGAITVVDSGDLNAGTVSRITGFYQCGAGQEGTFAVNIIRSWNLEIHDTASVRFTNGAIHIDNPVLPVPSTLTQGFINISNYMDIDCGTGTSVYGSRAGQVSGLDTLGYNRISAYMNISNGISIRPLTYGLFVQGAVGVNATNIVVVDGGTGTQLWGGILFDSEGGTLSNFYVKDASGIALEVGGSVRTNVNGGAIFGSTAIGVNAGSSIGLRIVGVRTYGVGVGILASGFDGANNTNWFPEVGNTLFIRDCDFTTLGAGDRSFVASNGFTGVDIDDCVTHVKNAGALGLTYDTGGGEMISYGDNVVEINESAADSINWSKSVSVASATSIVIPTNASTVTVTGTTQVNTMRTQGESDYLGKIRSGFATNRGSGYSAATTATISGDGTGATCLPVISNGQISGIYVVNKGSGYTAATVAFTDPGGGSGATVVVNVGAAFLSDHTCLLKFSGACPVGNGAGNIYLSAAFTASVLGISSLPMISSFSNYAEIGR